ncbi:leucine-rich repeat-containing protein 28-like [Actinia tenebrosa]|uniref:Leucine-rich repeat-containing protein 28-like n=1 Tax=Actinia tenebrosa TaxID=6105 RepID=A0A6P8HLK9_ACTTE|nr:leucine-rich repeat-containing protein 28-like [Actinia tenebrosa]
MSCFLVSGEVEEIIQQAKTKSYKNLYLNYQHLSELPSGLLQLDKAEKLYLKYNILKKLPSDIYRLESLVELYLHSNDLQELPEEIGFLPCLKSLNVSNNFLKAIPATIGHLKKLEYLHLANNQLSLLCETLGNLHSLRVLDVMNNNLTRLPWQLCYCHKLENLSFDNNRIDRIPRQLMNLEHLKELSGSNNRLESLPQDLDHLLSLESLLLDSNVNLCALPGTLLKIPYLSTLGINSCGQPADDKTKGADSFSYFHGTQFFGNSEQNVLPLVELSLRATHKLVQSRSLPTPSFPLPANIVAVQAKINYCRCHRRREANSDIQGTPLRRHVGLR